MEFAAREIGVSIFESVKWETRRFSYKLSMKLGTVCIILLSALSFPLPFSFALSRFESFERL